MLKVFALIDCDSFFVSCEQAENPELKGKPVCVTGGPGGCILSRSKQAKALKIPMGYPLFKAKREFQNCIYVDARHEIYSEYSKRIMSILKDFSPNVEVSSIDEAYVDFTGLCKLYNKNYYQLAYYLKNLIKEKTDIPVSIGVSSTKILAKFASDYAKNNGGIYLIGKSKLKHILPKTNIGEICGIGKNMKTALNKEGILTCSEFVTKSDEWLKNKFSITMVELKHELQAESVYDIKSNPNPPKSIQETSSFAPYTNDIPFLKNEINRHIKDACRKMRRYNGFTSQISVMIKSTDFVIFSDKKNIHPTNSELEISAEAFKLFRKIYNPNLKYRTTGIVLSNLNCTQTSQLNLFNDKRNEKYENLSKSIDNIENKFGKNAIKTGFF